MSLSGRFVLFRNWQSNAAHRISMHHPVKLYIFKCHSYGWKCQQKYTKMAHLRQKPESPLWYKLTFSSWSVQHSLRNYLQWRQSVLSHNVKERVDPSLYPDSQTKSKQGLFWTRTHPPFKFRGNPFRCFCVILLTNQPTDANVHTAISLAVVYPAVTVVVGPILYRTIQPQSDKVLYSLPPTSLVWPLGVRHES